MLQLPRSLRAELIRHARDAAPAEAVGLLGGSNGDTVRLAIPLPNLAGTRAFHADPRAQFLAERRLRASGLRIAAIYHSHPGGGAVLSHADRELAARWPDVLQVVIAIDRPAGQPDEVRAYRPDATPVRIALVDG